MEYWRLRLTDSNRAVYDHLKKAIISKETTVSVPYSTELLGSIQEIYRCLLSDHPEFYYVSPRITGTGSYARMTWCLEYLYSTEQERMIECAIKDYAQQLHDAHHESSVDQVLYATYLLVKDSHYEIDNMRNQNAASVIYFHSAQCAGFASAFQYAMEQIGMWCITVSGYVSIGKQNSPHAWNIIYMDDCYYHVDITALMQQTISSLDQVRQYRLFESDDQKKQRGYVWKTSEVPSCDRSFETEYPLSQDEHNKGGVVCEPRQGLITYSRLYDLYKVLKEDMQNHIACCEFALNIPMYSNEKLIRMIMSYIQEQGYEQNIACHFEVQYSHDVVTIKFNYN